MPDNPYDYLKDKPAAPPPRVTDKREQMLDWFKTTGRPQPNSITCDSCGERAVCLLAYDPYNTDGDCLADK